jgi:cation diffusion facilitator CzcD-associated flavoprotein CzcO
MPTHFQVAIIGTGFSGLCMAIELKRAGIHDFVLLERAQDLGGTWRNNHYPGCACDVQSHLYSFSFAPNPNWSRQFAPQQEIWDYLRRCATQYGILPHIRYGQNVVASRFDEASAQWTIRTEADDQFTADLIVSGAGALCNPEYPDIVGKDTFTGESFHSAEWRHDVALQGKRVAVIGSGASAIQFVPRIVDQVSRLDYYQRTAPWVLPKPDWRRSEASKALARRVPFTQKLQRWLTYWTLEMRVLGFVVAPKVMKAVEWIGRQHIHRTIRDPEKRAAVTPSFSAGCKRVLMSNDYYQALAREQVSIVTEGIERIVPGGVVTRDGQLRPADVIIWGTGFRVQDPVQRGAYTGVGGVDLADAWKGAGGPEAYLGINVAGFPNLFMLMGPNTGLGHSSMVFMIESQVRYTLDAILKMRERKLASLDVRPEVQRGFVEKLQQRLKRTVWGSGCMSWYLNRSGKSTVLWPGSTFRYRQLTSQVDLGSYIHRAKP